MTKTSSKVFYSWSSLKLHENTTLNLGLVRPPTVTSKAPNRSQAVRAQFTSSLSFFIGSAFTVLDAGLALKTQGSFVNGFTPFRAGVAFFDFSFKFSMPAILNEPVVFNCSPAIAMRPSIAPFTSEVFKPDASATDLCAAVAVMAVANFPAFMAFMAFMATIGTRQERIQSGVMAT